MKKLLLFVLIFALAFAFAAASEEKTTVRLGGLKGPTSMGMVKLLDEAEQGNAENDYEFVMAGSADELTPLLLRGELDILAVPVNLGSVLYNKTGGQVRFLAINTLGVIYVLEKGGETVKTVEDLKGKTIYATGKGTTPEYALRFLLSSHGLDMEKDVNVEWKSEPTETVAALNARPQAVAMLPQPYVTVAQSQVEGLRIALDLTKEWEALDVDSAFITAGLIVRARFAEEHPEAIERFLRDYEASSRFANENAQETALLVEKYGIVKAAVAEKALPYCNIVFIDGEEMKTAAQGYLSVLYAQNPASVGGALPGEDFYYEQ